MAQGDEGNFDIQREGNQAHFRQATRRKCKENTLDRDTDFKPNSVSRSYIFNLL